MSLAVGVLKVASRLPRTFAGRHVGSQLVRAATSVGANYEEARGAESRADSIHKLRIAAKEARESVYWLNLAQRAELAPSVAPSLERLSNEATQLGAILVTSARTAKDRAE
jgi:four helix bundle protein